MQPAHCLQLHDTAASERSIILEAAPAGRARVPLRSSNAGERHPSTHQVQWAFHNVHWFPPHPATSESSGSAQPGRHHGAEGKHLPSRAGPGRAGPAASPSKWREPPRSGSARPCSLALSLPPSSADDGARAPMASVRSVTFDLSLATTLRETLPRRRGYRAAGEEDAQAEAAPPVASSLYLSLYIFQTSTVRVRPDARWRNSNSNYKAVS